MIPGDYDIVSQGKNYTSLIEVPIFNIDCN